MSGQTTQSYSNGQRQTQRHIQILIQAYFILHLHPCILCLFMVSTACNFQMFLSADIDDRFSEQISLQMSFSRNILNCDSKQMYLDGNLDLFLRVSRFRKRPRSQALLQCVCNGGRGVGGGRSGRGLLFFLFKAAIRTASCLLDLASSSS